MMHGTVRYAVYACVVEFRVGNGEIWEEVFRVQAGLLPILLVLVEVSGVV